MLGKSSLIVCGSLLLPLIASGQLMIEPLLVEGEPVPGIPGATFGNPDRVATNDSGQALILTDRETLWGRQGPEQPFVPLIEIGDPAPGVPDAFFRLFTTQPARLGETGIMATRLSLEGAGVSSGNDRALFSIDVNNGDVHLIAREGQDAPDTTTRYAGLFPQALASDDGPITFAAELEGFVFDNLPDALYEVPAAGETPSLLARRGDAAPGLEPGVTFEGIRLTSIENGTLFFSAKVEGPGVDVFNDEGLWYGTPIRGNQILLAREGDPAPGSAAGDVFGTFFSPTVLEDGQVMFLSELGSDLALYLADPLSGTTTLIVKEGDAVPGVPGATIVIMDFPQISQAGIFATRATLEGPGIDPENNFAMLQGDRAGFRVLGREGEEFPSGSGEGRFRILNDAGQLAFITFENASGTRLYATRGDGRLLLIAQEGTQVDVGGVARTISRIDQLGLATRDFFDSFADDGTLSFLADLDDGSVTGVFSTFIPDVVFEDGFEAD